MVTLLILTLACSPEPDTTPTTEPQQRPIPAFANIARDAMGSAYRVINYRPGVAIFDYDRDGDNDIYLTQ